MAEPKKKKSIFDQAIDALTNRDEKAAEAAKAAEEAAKKAEAETARLAAEAKAKKDAMAAELAKKAEEAKKAAEEAAKKAEAELKAKKEQAAKDMAAMADKAKAEFAAKADAIEKAKIKHVWTKEDTYASLAQKYYGSFKEPYWRLIYEHNKAIIGNHPNDIRLGLEIEIPPLPEELKLKK